MLAADTIVIDIAAKLKDQTSAGVSKVKDNVDKLGNSIKKMKQQMSKMDMNFDIKDKATKTIEKITKSAMSLGKKTWNVAVKVLDKATAPLKGIVNLLKNPILQAGTVLGISLGGANTFQTYQNFEKSVSNVKGLSGASAEDMKELTAKAREMGKTTTKSASEAADAFGYMALAGWNKDQMKEAIQPVLHLSEAGNLDLGRTSDLVTDSMSSLGIKTGELQGYLDKVAKTASSSNTNIDAMMEAFLEFGGTVKNNNISLEEASGLIGILANRGVKGSEAGNALNSVFVNLTTGLGQAGKAMKELGLSAYDSEHKFKGYAATLKELYDKTKDLDEEQKEYYYSAIGGKTRLSDLQHLLSGVSEEYDELKDKVANSNGALEEMANIMNDNIYGDVKALQSAFESVQLDFMDKFQPSARKFLQWSKDMTLSLGQKLTKAAEKFQYRIEKIESAVKEFKDSKEWQNADLSGKIRITWDKIIAEPFAAWWSGKGKEWACGVANDIGYGISSALTAGISALLGIDLGEATESGFDIGKSFAEGFLNGFDGSKLWEGIKEKSKEVIVNASKILPGGEQATGGSWLSAGLLAYGGIKAGKTLGAGKLFGTLGGGATEKIASVAKAAKPVAQNADNYVDFWKNAKLWNVTTREIALKNAPKNGMSVSALDDIAVKIAPYIAKAKTTIATNPAIGKAGKFLKGNGLSLLFSAGAVMQSENKAKETIVQGGSFATSLAGGSLGTKVGAAIGSAIAPGVGTAIGSAIGGLAGSVGAYMGGEKLFRGLTDSFKSKKEKEAEEAITKEKEKQLSIEKGINDAKNIQSDLKNTNDLIWETEYLKKQWKDVQEELEKGDLSEQEKLKKQQESNHIVEKLTALYPNIISAEDAINGKLEERIDKQQEINQLEQELQKRKLEEQNKENMKNFDTIHGNYKNSQKELFALEKQENDLKKSKEEIKDLYTDNQILEKEMKLLEKGGLKSPEDKNSYHKKREQKLKNQEEMVSIMKKYDFTQGAKEGQYIVNNLDSMLSAMNGELEEINKNYIEIGEESLKWEKQENEMYDKLVKQIELDYGEPLEQAIGKYDEMDAAGQQALKNALIELEKVNQEFGKVPDKLFTEFVVKVVYDGVLPQEKLHQYGVAGPIETKVEENDLKFVKKRAAGGIINQAHLGIIGEAGPEAIIPLSGTNKHRGISLWQQAGEMLGMLPKHAQGGVFGGSTDYKSMFEEAENKKETTLGNITISIGGMNFTFTGDGTGEKESIIGTIRQQMPEIANEVAETIAKELQKLLPNMKASIA